MRKNFPIFIGLPNKKTMKRVKFTLSMLFVVFFINSSSAQDWAKLSHYQKENATVVPLKNNEQRIVFMGNSITAGWIAKRPEFFANKPYVNRGIGGQTTPQMLLRFRQDVINLKPTAVVLLAGINDIAGNTGPSTIEMIVDNIVSMVELARVNDIKVILCSVLPAYDFPWRKGLEPAEKVIALNAQLKVYAEQEDILYVDYFSAMVDESNGLKEELGTDGIHPNESGYLIMEPLVEDAIAKTINKK